MVDIKQEKGLILERLQKGEAVADIAKDKDMSASLIQEWADSLFDGIKIDKTVAEYKTLKPEIFDLTSIIVKELKKGIKDTTTTTQRMQRAEYLKITAETLRLLQQTISTPKQRNTTPNNNKQPYKI